jgi:hypothetical protein
MNIMIQKVSHLSVHSPNLLINYKLVCNMLACIDIQSLGKLMINQVNNDSWL